MHTDVCSSCGKPVARNKRSSPEIVCHDCRWERRVLREAGRQAERVKRAKPVPAPKPKPVRDPVTTIIACDTGCGQARRIRIADSGQPYTCHKCRRNQYHDSVGKRRIDAACEHCGEPFKSRRSGHSATGWTRYCSLACANRHKEPVLRSTPEQKQAKKRAKDRQRRMRIQAATYDGVTDQEIFERDKWMCRMDKCLFGSRRINPKRKWPDPRAASVDHILPIVHGGDDTAFNKRASHLRCNITRNAGRPGEQLPLGIVALASERPKPARKPCPICGEPFKGKRCKLHMPVHYSTCQACERLFVHGKGNYVYCSAECSHSARYARHDQKIQARPAHLRGLEAKALRDAGMSLDEIADRLGYSGAPYAAAAIARVTGQRSSRRTGPYVRQQRAAQRLTA